MRVDIIVGTTGPLDFDLFNDEAVPTDAMAGMTVELILETAEGRRLDVSGRTRVLDPENWRVRVQFEVGDLEAGSYRGRFEVADSDGKVVYFPEGVGDIWAIRVA